ncbi:hypothetical protein, partial [Rikenella microfusus]|uniref:hypothetical protein n=3 Tax=Rikenella microfusus TaxID=28139 RepID=UPI003AB34A6C
PAKQSGRDILWMSRPKPTYCRQLSSACRERSTAAATAASAMMPVMATMIAAITFVMAVLAVLALLIPAAILAFRAVFLARALFAGALLAATFDFRFFTLLVLVLCRQSREAQRAK